MTDYNALVHRTIVRESKKDVKKMFKHLEEKKNLLKRLNNLSMSK